MICTNCGNDIDFEHIVEENVNEFYSNSKNKAEVKEFLDNDYDFSVDQACDICYHTLWVKDKDKKYFYSHLRMILLVSTVSLECPALSIKYIL